MSIDLTTNYGGLRLRSPLVVGACPATSEESSRLAVQTAGAGAIVLPSLFEEQVIQWNKERGQVLTEREQVLLERAGRMQVDGIRGSAETYLSIVNRASVQLSVPVIASLNGENEGNWLDFAGELQAAGANAIELNIHYSPLSHRDGPREVEDRIVRLVRTVDDAITIPLFVKLSREYTSISHLARRLVSGVQGLVLYGRAPEVDVSLEGFTLTRDWQLTQPGSIVQTLGTLISVHSSCPAISIAACGGIGSASDVIKSLLAGADVAMVASAVCREGPDVVRTFLDGLIHFMGQHRFQSINELQAKRPLEFSSDEERLGYVKAMSSRIEYEQTQTKRPAMHSDQWGHLDVTADPD